MNSLTWSSHVLFLAVERLALLFGAEGTLVFVGLLSADFLDAELLVFHVLHLVEAGHQVFPDHLPLLHLVLGVGLQLGLLRPDERLVELFVVVFDEVLLVEVEVVFEGHGPVAGPDDLHRPPGDPRHPVPELVHVLDGRGEHDEVGHPGEEDDGLFPNRPALLVVDVVDLVEDDALEVGEGRAVDVELVPEDFGGHDQALGRRVQHHVPRYDPDC